MNKFLSLVVRGFLVYSIFGFFAVSARASFLDGIKNSINGPVTKQSCQKACNNPPTPWQVQAQRESTHNGPNGNYCSQLHQENSRTGNKISCADGMKAQCFSSCEKYPNDAATASASNTQANSAAVECKKNIEHWKKQAADLNQQYGFLSGNKHKDQRASVKAQLDPLNIKIADCKKRGVE